MKRDLGRLETDEFDLLIIGGGIYGAATARCAALHGLKVGLIEKTDFSCATSSNSLKIIHGGLRYLQHGDFRRMRRSIRARRTLLRIAPHLVDPLKFVIPTYGHFLTGKEVMALALAANNLVSWDRNRSTVPSKYIPAGRVISRRECLDYLPNIEKNGLTGGAIWYDCIARNTERLTLEFILAAVQHGAAAANYVMAESFILNGSVVRGVKAKDLITNQTFKIHSKVVINATGPWINNLLHLLSQSDGLSVDWAKSVNVILKKPLFGDYAVGLFGQGSYKDKDAILSSGKRLIFCVPWRKGTIIGTTYKRYIGDPKNCHIEEQDVFDLLNQINIAYPTAKLSSEDVSFFHVGLVPIAAKTNMHQNSIQLMKRSRIYDHERMDARKGLITLNGVKYTTATELAKDALNLVFAKLHRRPPVEPHESLLPGGETTSNISDFGALSKRSGHLIGMHTLKHLRDNYGSRYKMILELVEKDPELGGLIAKEHPIIKAEVIHAVREEMAQTISDLVMRRTNLGSFGDPGKTAITSCAEIMGHELGWDARRQQLEIDSLQNIFKLPPSLNSPH